MFGKEDKKLVVVSPGASVSVVLHAVKHTHHQVHGVLLGSFENGGTKVNVEEAVPVCHGAPTKPLLECALSLIESVNKDAVVVGWYVSPRLHMDERPGPAALKIVSVLATNTNNEEPVLLVLGSGNLGKVQQGDENALEASFKAMGKNLGNQWLDPLKCDVNGGATAIKRSIQVKSTTSDLVDHLECERQSDWYSAK